MLAEVADDPRVVELNIAKTTVNLLTTARSYDRHVCMLMFLCMQVSEPCFVWLPLSLLLCLSLSLSTSLSLFVSFAVSLSLSLSLSLPPVCFCLTVSLPLPFCVRHGWWISTIATLAV